jgi:hypothetical protein
MPTNNATAIQPERTGMSDKKTTTDGNEIMVTPVKVALHRRRDNPIYGEGVIYVSVDDECVGPFLVLTQNHDSGHGLRIDLDELEAAVKTGRYLIAGVKAAQKSNPKGQA